MDQWDQVVEIHKLVKEALLGDEEDRRTHAYSRHHNRAKEVH